MAVADKQSALSRVATDPVSRRKLLAVTGGSTALAAFLAACGGDSDSTTMMTTGKTGTEKFGKGDVGILNYALTLEYLETAFYADVVKSGLFKGSDLATIQKFGSEEAEHVTADPSASTQVEYSPSADARRIVRPSAYARGMVVAVVSSDASAIVVRRRPSSGVRSHQPQRRGAPCRGARHSGIC